MVKRINVAISDDAHDIFLSIKKINNVKTQDDAMELLLLSLGQNYQIINTKQNERRY